MSRREDLARRRANLVARSRRLRDNLAVEGERIGSRLALVDKGVAMARSLARQPLLVAAVVTLMMTLKPLRAMKWAARGALLFSVARRVYGAVDRAEFARGDSGEPPTFI